MPKNIFICCLFSIFACFEAAAQVETSDSVISIIFAGDIMGHSPQFQAAYNRQAKTYEYDICFNHVKKYISSADIAVANLETPIAGPPYSGYPRFSSPDELLYALKNAGYDVLLTANNHVADKGKKGLERTLDLLHKNTFLYLGSYYDNAQRDSIYPLIIEQKGLKIALLNCTYGTNGLPVTHPNIVNLIDTAQIKEDIKKAGESGADLEIMAIHWGEEYELRANETQRDPATFLVNQGIDAIIGAHPHVVQNFETLLSENREIPVYYSLGNSISNQREPHTNGGIMVKLLINVNTKQIIDHSYLPVYVYKGKLNGVYQYHLIPTTDFIRRMPRFELNKTDSAGLMYFHEQTVKRLANSKLMADVDNKPIPLPKVRMSKIATPLDRFRQQYHLKF